MAGIGLLHGIHRQGPDRVDAQLVDGALRAGEPVRRPRRRLGVCESRGRFSVISIRHINATFAELQHLQSIGDVAEEIDRRTNELRLAARDFVTDPAAPSNEVWEATSSLSALLKKTRLQLAPEQQQMIDGVTQRLANYRSGIERVTALIARRAELIAALPPLRERFETATSDVPDRATATKRVWFSGWSSTSSARSSNP